MMTRDYLSVKVWDLNMENRPVETYQVWRSSFLKYPFLSLFFFFFISNINLNVPKRFTNICEANFVLSTKMTASLTSLNAAGTVLIGKLGGSFWLPWFACFPSALGVRVPVSKAISSTELLKKVKNPYSTVAVGVEIAGIAACCRCSHCSSEQYQRKPDTLNAGLQVGLDVLRGELVLHPSHYKRKNVSGIYNT